MKIRSRRLLTGVGTLAVVGGLTVATAGVALAANPSLSRTETRLVRSRLPTRPAP